MNANPYLYQCPELMSGKTILYVHGFASSGQSGTAKRIQQTLPNATVVAPDLPLHPQEALDMLRNLCDSIKPALIIGTSMGGMYTEMLYGYDRICINPAFRIADTMAEHGMMGRQQYFGARADGVQEFYVDKPLVKEFRSITEQCFSCADAEGEQQRVYGLFGDEDTLVDTIELFSAHYPTAIRFHGEHRMNDNSFMHSVMPVIRWIDDRQSKRERPIVYITMDALIDHQGKPYSSSQKTIRRLLDNYQVIFVAPATANAQHYSSTIDWLYQYINVPAYGHTIFANQTNLLYGDYIISQSVSDSMATVVEFGSDTFKTWDDIAYYFDKLGGQ